MDKGNKGILDEMGHEWTLYKHLSFLLTDYFSILSLIVSRNQSHTETPIITHTNFVLEPFEMILISYQTTTCPREEMEVAATDMLKCHIGLFHLKAHALSADHSLGLQKSVPPSSLPFLSVPLPLFDSAQL